jgi:hypothetical protein
MDQDKKNIKPDITPPPAADRKPGDTAVPPAAPDVAPTDENAKTFEPAPVFTPKKSRKKLIILSATVLVLLVGGIFTYLLMAQPPAAKQSANTMSSESDGSKDTTADTAAEGLKLDEAKNYGNKYKNGVLPVGDNKYSSTAAKKGNVYTCSGYSNNLKNDSASAGAGTRGPWFTNNNQSYDINKKAKVQGSVKWTSDFKNTVSGSTRTITSNDLPDHVTGTYPIASSDPAYAYDRNPNSIKAQSISYSLPASPTYGSPQCMGGEAGIMLTGVKLFNGFDAGGRDAGAWEVQDSCAGHPQVSGAYHYHTLSSCITDVSVYTVIGFALDGFPITGPKVGDENFLTTDDLDECHGIISKVNLDGKSVTTYHYVMTQDFPYSISCFRSKALETANPEQGGGQTGGQQPAPPAGSGQKPPPKPGAPPPP